MLEGYLLFVDLSWNFVYRLLFIGAMIILALSQKKWRESQ